MAETNKILEVTYGEFSCRLEGFEDSVETMKAVVAYFHELGGHENFRDMRAQAPDAATLALLTEEQTGGTVEVENTGAGVSLRFHADPVDEDDASEDRLHAVTLDEDTSWEDADADVATDDEAGSDVALGAEDMEKGEADASGSDEPDHDWAEDDDVSPEVDQSDDEGFEMSDEESDERAPLMSDDAPVSTETSVTDRLQRIRAVVGRGSPPTSDGYAEDVTDPDEIAKPKAVNPLAQRLAELAKRNSEIKDNNKPAPLPETEGSSQHDAETPEEYLVDSADVRAADDDKAAGQDFEDTTEENVAEAADQEFADDAEAEGNVLAADDVDARLEDDTAEMSDEDAVEAVGHEEAEGTQEATDALEEDDTKEVAEVDVDEVAHDDAAVSASDDDAPEEIAETDDEPAQPTESRPLLLTSRHSAILGQNDDDEDDDDEFDLKAELAAIEREIAARPGNEVARHGLPRSVEDAMSRILNETNEQLNEPESRRHRDAFAQLKAAVAATEASRQLGDLAKSRDISAQFRDDLGALDAEDKAKGESLPPLKLVTPIRDDNEAKTEHASDPDLSPRSPKPLDAASNRLQQIAAKAANGDGADQTSFAAFAQEQGAHELADMLEAAAAYISYVEGDDDFSRPQVMKVVQSASEAEISREDGLRSFGRLLRQSRIVKLNNGRFQISENSRFRPETGRAARG